MIRGKLSELLAAKGGRETERNLTNMISRGGFTAGFFIQCLEAVGYDNLRLS